MSRLHASSRGSISSTASACFVRFLVSSIVISSNDHSTILRGRCAQLCLSNLLSTRRWCVHHWDGEEVHDAVNHLRCSRQPLPYHAFRYSNQEYVHSLDLIMASPYTVLTQTKTLLTLCIELYTYKNSPDSPLKTIAIRSFFGALATLTSAVVNLTVLMVLKGEPAWVCLMCCNADVLFSVIVLHWVTSKDSAGTGSSRTRGTNSKEVTGGRGVSLGREAYGLGSRVQPTVTTLITASKIDGADLKKSTSLSDDEREVGLHQSQKRDRSERLDWARGKRTEHREGNNEFGGEKGYPLGKIRVQVGQVVEIESESNSVDLAASERSMSGPRPGEMMGSHGVMGHRANKQSSQSTEDLVERGPNRQ